MRVKRCWLTAAVVTALASLPATTQARPGLFEVGAAETDITPPALASPAGRMLDRQEFVPACGSSEADVRSRWPGRRLFAFEEPYIDLSAAGRYVPGDPYCDASGTHRYQAPYIAGGSGANHWPLTSADGSPAVNTPATTLNRPNLANDPIGAQAVVFTKDGRKAAMVTVDSIGLFDSTMDRIRAYVHGADPSIAGPDIFISSTHDESAPDPIGLWGPDLSNEPAPVGQLNSQLPAGVTSGVDEYYMSFLVRRVAGAVVAADRASRPARLRLVTARMPANTQSCWSSYPFIDTGLMPVMQAVDDRGRVVFTLVDVGTHDESLAFSGDPAYTSMLSGDWTGRLAVRLAQEYPGSVGMEMAGLVGSVETPALYPEGTRVLDVPGAHHDVPGTPVDGCSSVYPEPAGARPVTDALAFVDAYAKSVADTAVAALASPAARTESPDGMRSQTEPVCVQLENNLFLAGFALDLFPDRPAYADPACTVGVALAGDARLSPPARPAPLHPAGPAFLRSEVGVLTVGPVQIAYSPGEVFPVTEVGGPYAPPQMPFPTSCYLPGNYSCGAPLPMTPGISAEMTAPYRFFAGLGQDMIGYIFPPSDFVGSQGEVAEPPWSVYELTAGTGHDRFGYGHSDDSESVGPNAGLAVTRALGGLLARDGAGTTVRPGLFVDARGRLCDSPFPTGDGSWVKGCGAFSGAVGARVLVAGRPTTILVSGATRWGTYLGTPDAGTAGTSLTYSTATRGVIVDGKPILLDVVAGWRALIGS